MEFIKAFVLNLLRFFISFIFVLSLSSLIITWILSDFTAESNIKPIISDIVYQSLSQQMDDFTEEQIINSLSQECSSKEIIQQNIAGFDIKISCKDFSVSDDIKKLLADSVAASIYEKEDCGLECITKNDFSFLVTARGNKLYQNLLLIFLAISVIAGISFVLLEQGSTSKRLRGLGVLMMLTCLPGIMTYFLVDPMKKGLLSYNSLFDPIIRNVVDIAIQKYLILIAATIFVFSMSLIVWIIERRKK